MKAQMQDHRRHGNLHHLVNHDQIASHHHHLHHHQQWQQQQPYKLSATKHITK